MAKVHAYVDHRGVERKAKGFSCKEIEEAKLSCAEFDALHLPWDSRRNNSYKRNVETLKKLERPKIKARPAKKESKPAKK